MPTVRLAGCARDPGRAPGGRGGAIPTACVAGLRGGPAARRVGSRRRDDLQTAECALRGWTAVRAERGGPSQATWSGPDRGQTRESAFPRPVSCPAQCSPKQAGIGRSTRRATCRMSALCRVIRDIQGGRNDRLRRVDEIALQLKRIQTFPLTRFPARLYRCRVPHLRTPLIDA